MQKEKKNVQTSDTKDLLRRHFICGPFALFCVNKILEAHYLLKKRVFVQIVTQPKENVFWLAATKNNVTKQRRSRKRRNCSSDTDYWVRFILHGCFVFLNIDLKSPSSSVFNNLFFFFQSTSENVPILQKPSSRKEGGFAESEHLLSNISSQCDASCQTATGQTCSSRTMAVLVSLGRNSSTSFSAFSLQVTPSPLPTTPRPPPPLLLSSLVLLFSSGTTSFEAQIFTVKSS